MFYMHGIGWGWWLLMSFGIVAFWGLVIWGIVVLVRGGSSAPRQPEQGTDQPIEIMQRRLARGEVSLEEYEELRDALIGRRPEWPKKRSQNAPKRTGPDSAFKSGIRAVSAQLRRQKSQVRILPGASAPRRAASNRPSPQCR